MVAPLVRVEQARIRMDGDIIRHDRQINALNRDVGSLRGRAL